MQQPNFHEASAANPTKTAATSKWLARVSHRASSIPNRQLNISAAAAGPGASSSLRTPGSAGGITSGSLGELSYQPKHSSYPASPVGPTSPTETEFGTTPVDSSFGNRVDPPLTARAGPELPFMLSTNARSRSGTVTRADVATASKMDKYARQAGDNTYDSDAEADDEFERSVFSSPIIAGHFADDQSDLPSDSEEEEDHSVVDGQDTPTTQGWTDREGRSPTGKITQWTEEEAADYIASLSPALKHYSQTFIDEGVNGEALVALHHDELRELGVASVGHRLTILKAVYEQKRRSGVKIEEGDYVPLSAEGEKADMNATQDDIARVIESIRLRDQRIIAAEAELRALKLDLDRISDENRKLREETLPIVRLMKDQRTPLPDPVGGTIPSPRETDLSRQQEIFANQNRGGLSRKFSTKKLFLKSDNTKQPSPTHPSHTPQPREIRDDGGAHLEASAAAMAASSHLTASMTSQTSPSSAPGQLSPTSPAYSIQQPPASAGMYHPPGSSTSRSFPREPTTARPDHRSHIHVDDTGTGYSTNSQWSTTSTLVADQENARAQDRSRRQPAMPSPREDQTSRDRDNPQVEIFKSFRVSIEDPCRVVLPVALKRYNITDDWRQYALYIVHGDQERCLGLEEKPLLLFKQLDKEGRKPMFMLRRHASPQEGWSKSAGAGNPSGSDGKQVPGGVL